MEYKYPEHSPMTLCIPSTVVCRTFLKGYKQYESLPAGSYRATFYTVDQLAVDSTFRRRGKSMMHQRIEHLLAG